MDFRHIFHQQGIDSENVLLWSLVNDHYLGKLRRKRPFLFLQKKKLHKELNFQWALIDYLRNFLSVCTAAPTIFRINF